MRDTRVYHICYLLLTDAMIYIVTYLIKRMVILDIGIHFIRKYYINIYQHVALTRPPIELICGNVLDISFQCI